MKEIRGFECDKCETFYDNEELAAACEKEHTQLEEISVVSIKFGNLKGKKDDSRNYTKNIPQTIQVTVGKATAYYRLMPT